ncbi:hypothetical protein C0J52_19685 [Blattella germanica]|nr:hypothetical protein C0J52_19685 [Blattella germanica]
MYAAIEEPGQVYTSGSETYAQIFQQTAAAAAGDGTHYPPQPPSVDSLKQVAQVHSRQASSSSATSSVANLGSPKPEKRQANSPLPPPPAAGSPELYAAVDKSTVSRNLEEMYAKVMKKKQREASEGSSSQGSPTQPEVDTVSASGSDPEFVPPPEVVEPSYESLGGPSSIDPGYEVVQRNTSDCDPNYEELRPQNVEASGKTDPGYEQVGATALPNYEELRPQARDLSDSDVTDLEGIQGIDPNYEQVKKYRQTQSSREESNKIETEFPGYEQVGAAALEVGYAKVNKNRGSVAQESVDIWANLGGYEHVRAQDKDNPNKESKQEHCNGDRPSSSDGDTYSGPEPDYASVNRDNPEPNYESMSSDANYESVNYFDPPYERLHNETRDSDDTSNYEKVSNTQWDAINGNTNLCRM